MEALRNLWGGQKSNDPPESVLAEWNKYSGEGDVETGGGESSSLLGRNLPGLSTSLQDSFKKVTSTFNSASESASAAVLSVPSQKQWYYFGALMTGGLVLLFLAFFIALPIIVIAPAKFAFSFTLGSALIMASFTALKGFKQQMMHMISQERLPFSLGYLGSMAGTLYAAVVMKSYLLSLVFSGAQVVALLYYLLSYFPGGSDGVKFVLNIFYQGVKNCCGIIFRS